MNKVISEHQLRERLSSKLSEDEIQDLIDRYVEATSLEDVPDMDVITELAQKSRDERILRVSFKLETEQYDALAAYFKEPQQSASYLVRRALDDFISMIT